MKVVGYGFKGSETVSPSNDRRAMNRVTIGQQCYIPKLVIGVDGLGPDSGAQSMKAVLYRDSDGLLHAAGTTPVRVPDGSPFAWTDVWFDEPGGVAVDPGDYWLGVHIGEATQALRLYLTPDAGIHRRPPDVYADGPAPNVANGDIASALSLYAPYVNDWSPREEEDAYYARLPFIEAQVKLGETGARESRLATCGWHGIRTDPEEGSFALVNTNGPLADLVGDRLAIHSDCDVAYAYCHGEAELQEDLSLSRRLFMVLAPLATFELQVQVEVLA